MKIKYRKTLAVDMDGVLADFETEVCEAFGYGNRHLESFEGRYPGVDKDLIAEYITDPYNYEKLLPIFGGILLLNEARARGYYTVILTSRPKHLAEVTREWLEGFEIQYHELWYASNKQIAVQEFNNMYPNRKIFALVDDIKENLDGLPDGVTGIAWEQPWNEGFYPRIRYNENLMMIEVKPDSVSGWKRF
jgi:hypothetical protein